MESRDNNIHSGYFVALVESVKVRRGDGVRIQTLGDDDNLAVNALNS